MVLGNTGVDAEVRRALVIDDDEAALNLMRRRLARLGYSVLAAPDGETGLAMARVERPDLIVLDIFMPGRSGYDILKEIRSDLSIGTTPVIVVTVDDDRARGLRLGATEYLMKPVPQDQLVRALGIFQEQIDGEILVVEDDPDAADIIIRSAAHVGLGARHAADGLEGLRMIREKAPAAVILDLTLPGLDGFQVLEMIRDDRELAGLPVIIVSGRSVSLAEHEAILRSGCAYFMKGEFSPREIAQTLRTAVAA
jgi:DNA-binding response OmpR family regulator